MGHDESRIVLIAKTDVSSGDELTYFSLSFSLSLTGARTHITSSFDFTCSLHNLFSRFCAHDRYDYLFDPDECDDFKVPCMCKAPNCRKYMN